MSNYLKETLDEMKKAQGAASEDLKKAFSQSLGLVAYDLQAPALQLYPFMQFMTMLRNDIPRVAGGGDTATRWKAITGINTGNTHPGVAEGNRGGYVATSLSSYTAAYIGMGLEDYVTFEADYAAQGFDDAKAKAALGLLRSLMIQEENMLLGGNCSVDLGTTPTPTVSNAGTGGSIGAATYNVICVALTLQGFQRSSLANGIPTQLSKSNADGTTDTINGGAAKKSNAGSTTPTGSTSTISAYVTPVEGAVAYAWYVGTSGSEKLEAITTINSVLLTSLKGTGQAASAIGAADYSKDATYNMDGLLTFAKTANNSVMKALATGTAGTGTTLTSDGAGGVLEINDLLQTMFDTSRMGPTDLLVSSAGIRLINKLCIGNGGAPLFRFALDDKGGAVGLAAGATIGSYLNPITNQLIRVRVHPFMPAGTMLAYAREIPYPLNGVGNVFQVKTRRDYYQLEWPLKTRKYEYGVYCDEVLQHYAPFTLAKLYNVAGA